MADSKASATQSPLSVCLKGNTNFSIYTKLRPMHWHVYELAGPSKLVGSVGYIMWQSILVIEMAFKLMFES